MSLTKLPYSAKECTQTPITNTKMVQSNPAFHLDVENESASTPLTHLKVCFYF